MVDDKIYKHALRESNIFLKALEKSIGKDSKEYIQAVKLFNELLKEDYIKSKKYSNNYLKDIVNVLYKIVNNELLSPLTLDYDEFDKHGCNIRCNRIFMVSPSVIYDRGAFDFKIKHIYDDFTKKEIINPYNDNDDTSTRSGIYLYSGGVLTGQFFLWCKLRDNIINNHSYIPKHSIHIPISIIQLSDTISHDHNYNIYIMDSREPKFKALCEFYDVEIKLTDIKKYDIRKYEKLKFINNDNSDD